MKKALLVLIILFGLVMFTGCVGDNDEDDTTKYFIVSFDANYNNSNIGIRSQEIEEGKTASEPSEITRDGYNFLGWFDSEGSLWDFETKKVTKNIVLYAHWEEALVSLYPEKHLILDDLGNYGGSLDVEKYGEGAPLNGEYDNPESPYYLENDFYNMKSTNERTIFTGFEPYQQTMEDTSGIASALMVLNYFKEDIKNTYNELELLKLYEQVNGTEIRGNGTNAEGLKKLFNEVGYDAIAGGFINKGTARADQYNNFNSWVINHLENGRFILLRYQDNIDFEWNVIVGHDSMGRSLTTTSNVLIMGTPNDNWDHYQDGFTTMAASRVFRWWQDVSRAGHYTDQYDVVVVYPKTPRVIVRFEEERTVTQPVPERHLILNADGSFGGTTNAAKYGGAGIAKNGERDILTSNYYAFVDYYNMQSTTTRTMVSNFKAYQQTMASSCGISSALAVLNYFGHDTSVHDEVYLVEKAQELNNITIYNNGIGYSGLRTLVTYLGYEARGGSYSRDKYVNQSSMLFRSYIEFITWAKDLLARGIPIPVSWRPHGGHWQVIIGIDDMGTDYIYDDVLILADSSDGHDHYTDGYNTHSATLFYNQWYNGSYTYNQQYVVFNPKK